MRQVKLDNSKSAANRRSDGGGQRQRRRARRKNRCVEERYAPATRSIPTFDLLDHQALGRIERQADWILEKIGIEFRQNPSALELFRNAGARTEGDRVRFEAGLARNLCRSAPESFTLHARDPAYSLEIGGDSIVLMPGYGSPFVTDLDRGRRYATLDDFENFVRLTYRTPHLHHSGGTVCEPVDVPVNKRHLDMVRAHLVLSCKPFMGSVTSAERAKDSIALARLTFPDGFLDQNAVVQGNININSPLVFDGVMSAALQVYAAANQCVCVSPSIFGGAMGPVSPAAIAAQTLAEGMAGIALTQLVRPGCPVVFGSFHSTMNMRTGSLTFGTPEANLVTMALSQLGHRLGVPVRSGGGQITAANAPDGQALRDSANAMWATVLSGAHQVWHAAGWLEGGLTMSYEKFILDLDNCGAMLRTLKGMTVNDETLSPESYGAESPGTNFLSTPHTLRNFATANYDSLLPDAGSYEAWTKAGQPDAARRANAVWKSMLETYEPPPLSPAAIPRIDDFIATRKAAMADEWY